jgi:TusA-related sulfurtransferase
MANYTLDSLGLKCPQPILKVAVTDSILVFNG